MSDLGALQDDMARALLDGDFAGLAGVARPGPFTEREALSVHRNTVVHGLVQALRLSHPTVDVLVGEAFFDQAAIAYVRDHPPAGAWLTGYGADFAAFLEGYELARGLPYLADVARFDFTVETVAGLAWAEDGPTLDLGEAVLTLDASLTLIALDYPAAAIRDALDLGEEALAGLDVRPHRHVLALWRLPQGAGLRVLSCASAAFIEALQHGGDLDAALGADSDPALLQAEVFAAPFARIVVKSNPES
jgi:hypothetical protein